MDSRTISDNFTSLILENHKVIAALFTTFNFEPDFFEQEVIPLILDDNLAFSSDARIKSIQVREALSESNIPIEVFYDRTIFAQQEPVSPSMEYMHHGIIGDQGAFHAKLTFLLLQDCETEDKVLYVGAGSANITGAGWWENIECQHWEEVRSGHSSRRFINQLIRDSEWLANKRSKLSSKQPSALHIIQDFLANCSAWQKAPKVWYYGLTSTQPNKIKKSGFMRYLETALNDQASKRLKKWSLDIISPYFAEKFDGSVFTQFSEDLGVSNINLYLPTNDRREAICSADYLAKVDAAEPLHWCKWNHDLNPSVSPLASHNRRTHAKIYHFYNGVQSWVFCGSVNFSFKAFSDNQEAGFLVKGGTTQSLLSPFKETPLACPAEDLEKEEGAIEATATRPELVLVYDWHKQKLQAAVAHGPVTIQLYSPEGRPLNEPFSACVNIKEVSVDIATIEKLLSQSGFIKVTGRDNKTKKDFISFEALVQQINWTHKPLDLPNLALQEIIEIYAGLDSLRRNQLIANLKSGELIRLGLSSEEVGSTLPLSDESQFFCEYAELFHAFRSLGQKLLKYKNDKNDRQLDYYLTGKGLDSLPTLIASLVESKSDEKSPLDLTTAYLTLLCLIQQYKKPEFSDRPLVHKQLNDCIGYVKEIEESGKLTLIDRQDKSHTDFYKWFKEQFFMEYHSKEESND